MLQSYDLSWGTLHSRPGLQGLCSVVWVFVLTSLKHMLQKNSLIVYLLTFILSEVTCIIIWPL